VAAYKEGCIKGIDSAIVKEKHSWWVQWKLGII